LSSPCAVAIAIATGQRRRPQGIHIRCMARITLTRYPVGIAGKGDPSHATNVNPLGSPALPGGFTFVAWLGSPLPAIPLGSPNPPVCTLLSGATTVAGAALPVDRLPTFTSSLGRFGDPNGIAGKGDPSHATN